MTAVQRSLRSSATFLALALLAASARSQCPEWLPGFAAPGVSGNATDVRAQAWFDDGSGDSLFVGGAFTYAGDAAAARIARWDGSVWHVVGAGLNGQVECLTVFDDGTGPALYAGGNFTASGGTALAHVAKWDGAAWSPLGAGVDAQVYTFQVFDDGSGSALYVGGEFHNAGGAPASGIARWDGSSWSPVGAGLPQTVFSMTTFSLGGTPELFVCSGSAFYLYHWNGTTWNTEYLGIQTTIDCMISYDDGSGAALYIGGAFQGVAGEPALHIAKWDGSQWSALGPGLGSNTFQGTSPYAMAVHDAGNGPELFVGGGFTNAGATSTPYVARWNGTTWSAAGAGTNAPVLSFSVHDVGNGEAIFAGGWFTRADTESATGIARFQNGAWSHLSSSDGIESPAESLLVFDDGTGPALYAGGAFSHAGDTTALRIARFDGAAWSAVGGGIGGTGTPTVLALARHDDGSGPALFAGGTFATAGGTPAANIARWNGASWSSLGSGIVGEVDAIAVYDDGGGDALYVGGTITNAGGVAVSGIARWNGTAWSALGSGISGSVRCLAVYNDGGGPALFAGGHFTTAGGISAKNIARWRGGAWSALGSGLGPAGAEARALLVYEVFEGGSGQPQLVVGGAFDTAGGASFTRAIAHWNGTVWSSFGTGSVGPIRALAAYDLGDGPRLFAGGLFGAIGGVTAHSLASWNGSAWSAVTDGFPFETLNALAAFDDGASSSLFTTGDFPAAADVPSYHIAALHGCTPGVPGMDFCSPGVAGVLACPCGNPQSPPGDARGCNNSSGTGGAKLASSGQANLGSDTVALSSTGEKPSALSIFLQGNATIPSGAVFGQGVRCVGGSLKRLYVHSAVSGSVAAGHGVGTDLRVHERSEALGDEILPGTRRFYMVYYRDPAVLGGCPTTSTFNGTQAQRITWAP